MQPLQGLKGLTSYKSTDGIRSLYDDGVGGDDDGGEESLRALQ